MATRLDLALHLEVDGYAYDLVISWLRGPSRG
jgi:hypothetical protein